jgi:hypothetical protein
MESPRHKRVDPSPITEAACWARCRRKFFDEWEATKSAIHNTSAAVAIAVKRPGRDKRSRSTMRLTSDHLLRGLRGVKRASQYASSYLSSWPSIQPWQSAAVLRRFYNPVRAMIAMQPTKIIKNTILICTPYGRLIPAPRRAGAASEDCAIDVGSRAPRHVV